MKVKNGLINSSKRDWAVDKHAIVLRGTDFAKCAPCPGCGGKMDEEGLMLCSRIGPIALKITAKQARQCDGTRPTPPLSMVLAGLARIKR